MWNSKYLQHKGSIGKEEAQRIGGDLRPIAIEEAARVDRTRNDQRVEGEAVLTGV